MPKLSSIYGTDDNGFASRVAGDALGSPSEYSDSGSPSGEEGSRGNKPYDPATVSVKKVGMGNDSRACVKGNHGKNGCND